MLVLYIILFEADIDLSIAKLIHRGSTMVETYSQQRESGKSKCEGKTSHDSTRWFDFDRLCKISKYFILFLGLENT